MSEAQRILALARRASTRGERLCLATVVQVEGSAYRKPGARMLVTSGGERVGTISGGCLETEVSRKAWWLTADGARVERYASFMDEDGGAPYGLGCGGTVSLLLEQGEPVDAVLAALERVLRTRRPEVVVTALSGGRQGSGLGDGRPVDASRRVHRLAGTVAVLAPAHPVGTPLSPRPESVANGSRRPALEVMYLREAWPQVASGGPQAGEDGASARSGLEPSLLGVPGCQAGGTTWAALEQAARNVFATRESRLLTNEFRAYPAGRADPASQGELAGRVMADGQAAWFLEYLAPPPALTLFGAGDDAQPIAELAHTLGWRVSVVDGRAHLARRERFPQADEVCVLDYADPALRAACGMARDTDSSNAGALPPASHSSRKGEAAASSAKGAAAGPHGVAAGLDASAALRADEIAVILTHSYEQDRALLQALLPRKLLYLGILGPRHRTERLLAEIVPSLGLSVEQGLARLHSPVGLDLGAGDPAAVALSIVAEIQAVLHGRSVQITRSQPPARGAQPDAGAEPVARIEPVTGTDLGAGPTPDSGDDSGNFAAGRLKDQLV